MSTLRCLSVAVLVLGLTVMAAGQPPATPFLPTPPPPPAAAPPSPYPVGLPDYPPPPGPPTVWSYLGVDAQQREYRQQRLARTPFGEFREKLQNPLSKLTGGLIKPFPPLAAAQALLKDPGPIGAAAKVKLDKAGAPDRVKAVKELSAVDCYYWPEAEDALVGALRVDRNSCVRLEAAKALGTGCCCTKKTIAALSIAASSSDADGNPAEKCPQVVAAAHTSLRSCLERVCAACVTGEPVPPDPMNQRADPSVTPSAATSKPGPAGSEKSSGGLPAEAVARPSGKEYYDRVARRAWAELIPPAQAIAARTPQIPALLLLTSTPSDLEGETVTADVRTPAPGPENLLDMILGVEAKHDGRVAINTPASPQPLPSGMVRTANLYDRFFGDGSPPPADPMIVAAPVPPKQTATAQPRPVPAAAPTPQRPASTSWTPPPTPPAPVPAPATPALFTQPAVPTPAKVEPAPLKIEPAKPPAPATPAIIPAPPVPAARPERLMSDNPLPPLLLPKPTLPTTAADQRTPRAARVSELLAKPVAGTSLEPELDGLTAADLASSPALTTSLVKTAEMGTEPGVRTACVRALARGPATPEVLAGLERLVADRAVGVRVEAMVVLRQFKK